jgi:outer membrane autotransporter protein
MPKRKTHMQTRFATLLVAAATLASAVQAQENPFSGPRIGTEVSYEDFGSGTNGATVAALAGWDLAIGRDWVIGATGRYALVGVDGSETTTTPGGLLQTADVSIRDNWGLSARVGHVVGDTVLIFGEAGYESLRLDAIRTVRAAACVPPNGCQISREDFSFNEDLWTVGVGAEWALTENLRLRGQYTYGDSKAFDRNRLSLGIAWQF